MNITFHDKNTAEEIIYKMPTIITPHMKIAFDRIMLESMKYWTGKEEMPEYILSTEKDGNVQEFMEEVVFRGQNADRTDFMENESFEDVLECLQYYWFLVKKKKKKSEKFLKNLN